MYQVPENVIEDILNKYYFDDIGIYYTFDLSSVKGIKDMHKKDKKKFESVLTNLKETLRDQNVDDIPRFRISKWNSIDDFQITSDELCKTPFYYNKETSGWIAHVTFDIKEGKAIMVNQPNATVEQQVA
jgi:GH18 family chitinase